ncbi:MAG TPA: ChbG/HpnK family deacetylase [Candidatus Acidoferrales bacterium]
MKGKKLIVNADDLGMSRGITDAILIAHRFGFVTSASLMANMPASEYAVERLATAPRLEVGIHLNICAGKPISHPSEVASLVGVDGRFHQPAIMLRKLLSFRVDSRHLEKEFGAQIRWARSRGVALTHADSHHHMHIYPAAVKPFRRAIAANEIPCVRASRCTVWPPSTRMGGPHEGGLARRVFTQLYRRALQSTVLRKFQTPDSRISFLSEERRNLEELDHAWRRAFHNLPGGTYELACHPGLPEAGFSETDPIQRQRQDEFRWLTDPEFRECIRLNGIELITYRDLCDRKSVGRAPQHAVAQRNPG